LPTDILAAGFAISRENLGETPWSFNSEAAASALKKLAHNATRLSEITGPAQLGIKTSLNAAFVVDAATARRLVKEHPSAKELLKPYGRGRDVTKWETSGNGSFLVCTRESIDIERYPSILRHLKCFEKELRARYEVRRGDYAWWVIRQVARTDIYDQPKTVYPDLCSRLSFAVNTDGMYPNNTLFCVPTANLSLLAFLNSRLVWHWIRSTCPANRGGAYRLFNQYMNELPVRDEILAHPGLLRCAEKMVLDHRRINSATTPHGRASLQSQIAATDRQIDALVYELYGLTDEEIRIVEGEAPDSPTASDIADQPDALSNAEPTSGDEEIPDDVLKALNGIHGLDTEQLRDAARDVLSSQDVRRLETLNRQAQNGGLTPAEEKERDKLSDRYEKAMVVRASAIAELHKRGEDYADLIAP
jgi:TaqI-like C-terminal specificity domain